jgi:hypothetical protein
MMALSMDSSLCTIKCDQPQPVSGLQSSKAQPIAKVDCKTLHGELGMLTTINITKSTPFELFMYGLFALWSFELLSYLT